MNHETCNCHDCTQARFKMSFVGQLYSAMNPSPQYPFNKPQSEWSEEEGAIAARLGKSCHSGSVGTKSLATSP